MKKITLIIALVLALCMLVSCGTEAEKTPDVTEPPKPEKIDLSSFSICAAAGMGEEVNNEITILRDALNRIYGIQMRVGDDFVLPGEEIPEDTNEIVIGKTNRKESEALFADNLKTLDYKITYNGKRLAISGATEEATANAIRYLLSLVEADGLYLNVGYEYTYRHDYACSDAKINGVSIEMYTIVYKSSAISEDVAKEMVKSISRSTGYELKAVPEKNAPTENIIFVGSATELGMEFLADYGVKVDEGNVYVGYTYPKSAVKAIDILSSAWAENKDLADGYVLDLQENCVRIVMLGDSNTAGAKVPLWFEVYMTTRFPTMTYEIINSGIGGDSPYSGLNRLSWDVLEYAPDVVIVNFGCNGVIEQFGSPSGAVNEKERDSKVKWFLTGMENIIKKLIEANVEIVLATPIAYDEWTDSTEENFKNSYIGFTMLSDGVKDLAAKYSLECVDYFDNLMVVLKDYREETNKLTSKTIYGDRKHVDMAGALCAAMAYAEDHSKWGSDLVASVSLTANSTEAVAQNAEVKVISSSSRHIYYTYRPNAIPLPDNEYYAKVETFKKTDLAGYNRELLCVEGLEEGNYEIRYNGALVVTRTAEELAAGINIADVTRNPTQKISKEVFNTLQKKSNNVGSFRSFSYIETRYIRPNGLTELTVEERVANFKEAIEKKKVSGYVVSCMNSYIEKASKFDQMEAEIDYAEYLAQKLALVDAYRVEIIKVD